MKMALPCHSTWSLRFKVMLVLSGLWSFTTFLPQVLAQAPPNNDCPGATPIQVNATATIGNLTFATADAVPNGDGCSGTTVSPGYVGLWYSFTGTGGLVWPNTCFPGSVNVFISVYRGGCTALQCVAGDNDSGCVNEKFKFLTEAGVTYHMLVRSASKRDFTLQLSSVVNVPTNDVCSASAPVALGTRVLGNVTFATSDEDEVLNGNGCSSTSISTNSLGVWYTFIGTGKRLFPDTCFPGSTEMVTSVYKGTCGSTNLQCLVGSEVPCRLSEKLTFTTEVGVTYYMLLRTASGLNRAFELILSTVASPPALGNINANDLCTNALPYAIGTTVTGNVSLATPDGNDVPGDCLAGTAIGQRPGLWYIFDGPGGNVSAVACPVASSMAVHISVYKGASCGALTCVAGTYDPCTLPRLTFGTDVGTKYYILVRSASTSTLGPRNFDLTTYTPTAAKAPTPTGPSVPPPTPNTAPAGTAPMAPTAPTTAILPSAMAPNAAPIPAPTPSKKCGLFGLSLFCPLTRCGLLGRLFRLCK